MNIKNHFIEKGCGFPLIMLHGNGEDHSYFEHQIAYFSDKYRVIAIDTRGHGFTERGDQAFTIAQFADDLNVFMREHAIEKAHILGFSDGANIAMKFIIKYPDMVDKLILNGGNLFPAGVKRSAQIPIELGYRIANFFAYKSEGARKKAEILGLMVNDPFIAPAELGNITSHTLVIAGTKDLILSSHTKLIADSIPYSKLEFIEGDHFIAARNSIEFNMAVEKFLLE